MHLIEKYSSFKLVGFLVKIQLLKILDIFLMMPMLGPFQSLDFTLIYPLQNQL